MLTVRIEDHPSLIARIEPKDQSIFARLTPSGSSITAVLTPGNQSLRARIEPRTELEPYYETDNAAGGTTIIIGE